MPALLDELFHQHEWANLRLIEVCRALSEEQLDARAVGAFGSIRETLRHFVLSEPSYVTRIGGTYDGPTVGRGESADLDTLEGIVRASARGLAERARTIDAAPFTYQSPEGEEIDAAVVIVQALNHGTEHRGQICTILTALGLTPPGLDGWYWGEETGRIRTQS